MNTLITLAPDADAGSLARRLAADGLWTVALRDADGRVQALAVVPPSPPVDRARLADLPGVVAVLDAAAGHPRVDAAAGATVAVGTTSIGPGAAPVLIAGPCSVESEATAFGAAERAAAAGATVLRGGAFKPRTSPYAFQGAGAEGLAWLRAAADAHGLALVTEVLSERDVGLVAEAADLLQIGSRNMQNFALLKAAGGAGRPLLIKRGFSATLEEWLMAAEHALAAGAPGVILCERGVRGFDDVTRNLLDLSTVALVAHIHRLPVIVDPSHATGRRDLVAPLAAAARAVGAHGVMVETHPDPTQARSDAPQALSRAELAAVAAVVLEGDR
ncbi:MAG: 3-deoxy-7-phosphoheptulonate synthase [bacterium]